MIISYNNKWLIAIIILVLLIINTYYRYEGFNANELSNSDIATLGKSLCSSTNDDNILINRKTITADMFVTMNETIKQIVIDMILDYANNCKGMNGSDGIGNNDTILTLACNTDPWSMEHNIVLKITDYIKDEISRLLHINMNKLIILHDLMRHLNLLEQVIYPLQNSNLYTLHGIQYITVNSIKNIINNNLRVKDVLYTVLSRKNINVINNNDEHI
jgi:hypothetical protein